MGKTSLLLHMSKAGWGELHTTALAHFFLNIEMNDYRSRPNGERILLAYQARVRREWHDALKRDEGFNIGIINDTLLRMLADELWDTIRAEGMRKVSPSSLLRTRTLTNHPFPPLFHLRALSPSRIMPHPATQPRYTLLAICYMPHATHDTTRYTRHTTCYTRHTTRYMLHATCYSAQRITHPIAE